MPNWKASLQESQVADDVRINLEWWFSKDISSEEKAKDLMKRLFIDDIKQILIDHPQDNVWKGKTPNPLCIDYTDLDQQKFIKAAEVLINRLSVIQPIYFDKDDEATVNFVEYTAKLLCLVYQIPKDIIDQQRVMMIAGRMAAAIICTSAIVAGFSVLSVWHYLVSGDLSKLSLWRMNGSLGHYVNLPLKVSLNNLKTVVNVPNLGSFTVDACREWVKENLGGVKGLFWFNYNILDKHEYNNVTIKTIVLKLSELITYPDDDSIFLLARVNGKTIWLIDSNTNENQ